MTEGTLIDLFAGRDRIRKDLAAGHLHPLAVLRDPDPAVRTVPIGDLLCWCDGLDEVAVSRVLVLARVPWGKRVSLLARAEQDTILWQVKQLRPEIWDRWRIQLAMAKAA